MLPHRQNLPILVVHSLSAQHVIVKFFINSSVAVQSPAFAG
jgi:hypothetical protein